MKYDEIRKRFPGLNQNSRLYVIYLIQRNQQLHLPLA